MIYVANYADAAFRSAQKLNTKLAYKHGANKVFEYCYEDLSDEFKEEYKEILSNKRGAGYWVWKPYVILNALERISEGDYLIYNDSGSAPVRNYKVLIDAMDNENAFMMPFVLTKQDFNESRYTKRDAFVYLGLDQDEYANSPQFWAGIQVYKKCDAAIGFVKEWLDCCKDIRIISDNTNTCGLDNYKDFEDHRHDQSIYSLLCKKYRLKAFRDPSTPRCTYLEWYDEDVIDRSPYHQVFDAHRNGQIKSEKELTWKKKYLTIFFWKTEIKYILRKIKK